MQPIERKCFNRQAENPPAYFQGSSCPPFHTNGTFKIDDNTQSQTTTPNWYLKYSTWGQNVSEGTPIEYVLGNWSRFADSFIQHRFKQTISRVLDQSIFRHFELNSKQKTFSEGNSVTLNRR
jgi:hypothetical protein